MSSSRWTGGIVGATLTLALLLGPGLLAAQTEIRLSPRVGWLDPVGSFDQAGELESIHYVSYDEIGGMARVGVDLTLASSSFWGIRIGAATTVGGEARGLWDCQGGTGAGGLPLGCPSILLPVPSDLRIVSTTADLMLAPGPSFFGVRPFVLAGGGLIHHRFQWEFEPDEAISLAPGEATRTGFAAHFGVGARWEGRRLAVETSVEDLVTWPDRPSAGSQHAVAFSLGFGLRLD